MSAGRQGGASWFNRLQPLKGRLRLYLMTSAALLLLVSGSQALAEDEPAARRGSPPAAAARRPGGSRRAAHARPDPESQSVGSSCTHDQVRSTKFAIIPKEASPPLRVLSRSLGGQEARNNCAAWEASDGRRLS